MNFGLKKEFIKKKMYLKKKSFILYKQAKHNGARANTVVMLYA